MRRSTRFFWCVLAATAVWGSSPAAQEPSPAREARGGSSGPAQAATATPDDARDWTDAEIERFLTTARVVRTKDSGKGVTNSLRATLTDGRVTHDAHIQTVEEHQRQFQSTSGVEFDFRDSWTFNVAAYRLDRMLGLHLVPVSVAGRFRQQRAAVTWWVDDVMMDEGGRLKAKAEPPPDRARGWNEQIYLMRIFDQLIANTDRNLGNMLITKSWRLWAIDHTRAFRKGTTLRSPGQVVRCDRDVLEKLRALDHAGLKRALDRYLDEGQIRAILARRDAIVARLDALGPSAIFVRQGVAAP